MSHYAVAVFFDRPMDIDRLMAPFNEQDKAYFVFEPVSDEELAERWKKFHAQNPAWEYDDWLDSMYYCQNGVYGNWYNPNAKYDYYTIDGKDYLFFPFKSDADSCDGFWKKSQIDWFETEDHSEEDGEDEEDRDEAYWAKLWKEYSENGDGFFSEKYYLARFGTKEQFIKEMMRPTVPYAFVTPDGEWHAPGNMGWFAVSDETSETQDEYWEEWCKFIKEAPDCYVSILDCHI